MNFNATEYFKQAANLLAAGGRRPLVPVVLPVPGKRPDVYPQHRVEPSNSLSAPAIKAPAAKVQTVKTTSFNGFSALAYFAALG